MEFLKSLGNLFVDILETIAVALSLFVLIYAVAAQPHKVQGDSMLPNFQNNNFLLTDKISYRFGEIKRGDVIVFHFPKDPRYDYIKRVIALPGEEVAIDNNHFIIYNQENPQGEILEEAYLEKDTLTVGKKYLSPGKKVKMGEGEYFAVGDNREASSDSREWGPVKKEEIVGRAFFVYWPPQKVHLVKNTLAGY